MADDLWLSVVTVVKDDPVGFSQTLKSLTQQNLDGVEFVVIDSSNDRSAIPAQLEKSEIAVVYSWIKPEGIYAAMNASLDRATGEYLYFANAGDVFFDDDVLTRVRKQLELNSTKLVACDVLFGDVEIIGVDGERVITPHWDYEAEQSVAFSRGHFPCHQGTFTRRSVLAAQGGFDTSYSIVADYASFLKLTQTSTPVYIDFVIASFREGGISTTSWKESFRQFHRARKEILKPTGLLALRENFETLRRFTLVYLYREVIQKLRRDSV